MFELMAAFNLCEHLGEATFHDGGKVGYTRVLSPGRRPYRTKDGWVAVLPYTERNWRKILAEIGAPEVAELAWFKEPTERSRRVDELYAILANALPQRSTAEWLAVFERLDVPSEPVRKPADLLDDPHLHEVGFFAPNFAQATPVKRAMRLAMNVTDVASEPDLPPPPLGADGADILREAGCTAKEIAAALERR
jgi:crotonobetainyl-CoA:carnitine CoA-transferase CaiB-like acyl-CoA transferase